MKVASAKLVPYSSIVGSSVLLLDESGKSIGQLAVLNAGGKEQSVEVAQAVVDAFDNLRRHQAVVENLHILSGSNKS
jgi:hypothetical protein